MTSGLATSGLGTSRLATSRLAASRQRTSRLGRVLSTRDLPLAELCSARLDGELFALGDGWCAVDEPEGAESRAAAIALVAPRRVVAERVTAAWIFGAAVEPAQHQFCVDVGARVNVPRSPRLHLREVVGAEADTLCLGGLRVTNPLRTAVDLARHPPGTTSDLIPMLRTLVQRYGITTQAAVAAIGERSTNRAAALGLIAEAGRSSA
jgi:hypothetical protein